MDWTKYQAIKCQDMIPTPQEAYSLGDEANIYRETITQSIINPEHVIPRNQHQRVISDGYQRKSQS